MFIHKRYDIIVVGSGSGGQIVDFAMQHGFSVAWVDKGPLGGTCLNVGCIPSKMLIFPADRVVEIQESYKLGIDATVNSVDFQKIMRHMHEPIKESHEHMKKALNSPVDGFDYYDGVGKFVDDYTLVVNEKKIKGDKIFIGTGARPLIPPVKGLDQVDFLTNENVFDLKKRPESLIIIGGGYISVEFAHFFAAMGTSVTVLQRGNRLVKGFEPEISKLLFKKMSERMTVITDFNVTEVNENSDEILVKGINKKDGKETVYSAEKILVATGRISNSDLLNLKATGVGLDDRGFIKVDEFLRTTKKNIWAFGDANGKFMFKHVANEEAIVAWRNAMGDDKNPMDYSAVPYAVFTYPQIAGVGLSLADAKKSTDVLVGIAKYSDVAKGDAMVEYDGFAKAIVDKNSHKILGFHIIGPYAPILIQEVTNAMALGGDIGFIGQGMHIHPGLSELILRTFANLSEED